MGKPAILPRHGHGWRTHSPAGPRGARIRRRRARRMAAVHPRAGLL